jgi:hypothetical protein
MSSFFPLYYTYKVEFLAKEVGFCIHFYRPKILPNLMQSISIRKSTIVIVALLYVMGFLNVSEKNCVCSKSLDF